MPEQPTLTRSATWPDSAARSYVLPVTLLALSIRLILVIVVTSRLSAHWFFSQATELGCMANSAVHGEGLSSPFCGHTGPSAFLAPGYPLFVAVVFRLFGSYTMHSAAAILYVQALLGTACVPVLMWTARRAFSRPVAVVAGLLCTLNPWIVGLQAVLWETTLSMLLLLLLLYVAVSLQKQSMSSLWLSASCTLALAFLVNPSLVLTGVAIFIVVLVQSRAPLRDWFLSFILLLLLCSPWPLRNLRVMHAFIPMRSNLGYELWQGNRPGADGFFQRTLHPNENKAEYVRYATLGELPFMQEKSRLAKEWIRSHPKDFVSLTLKRIACFWTGVGRVRSRTLIASTAGLSLFGFLGLAALFRRDRRLAVLLSVPLLVLPLPYYITHPDFRFWCLLAPLLTLLGVSWIMHLGAKRNAAT